MIGNRLGNIFCPTHLFLVLAFLFIASSVAYAQEHLPDSAERTRKAWLALETKEYMKAVTLAEGVIKDYKADAKNTQMTLEAAIKKGKMKPPPIGKIPKKTFQEVMANGPINDVGACYVIKGKASRAIGKKDQARTAFTAGSKLTMARCWDANSKTPGYNPNGWIWDTSKSCRSELQDMDEP